MAFILDDILRVPGQLLKRIVKVEKGRSPTRALFPDGSELRARRGEGSPPSDTTTEPHRTPWGPRWPKAALALAGVVVWPIRLAKWAVNEVRAQADGEMTDESPPKRRHRKRPSRRSRRSMEGETGRSG